MTYKFVVYPEDPEWVYWLSSGLRVARIRKQELHRLLGGDE